MYEYIKGIFNGFSKDSIIVENSGIGYRILTSGSTLKNMPPTNGEVKIFIEQIVREDFLGLYGFLTKEEREMFNMLRNINGVGPKASLSLLSICTVDNLKKAIMSGDELTIIKAPGIGKKTAQRILLELSSKVEIKNVDINSITLTNTGNINDSREALIALGYGEKLVDKTINDIKLNGDESVENIIRKALLELMK